MNSKLTHSFKLTQWGKWMGATVLVATLWACQSAPEPVKGPTEAELNAKAGIKVEQAGKDVKIAVNNQVLFETAKFDLKPEAITAINRTAQLLSRNKALVMVEGHTDSQGSKDYNQKLSEDRALAVKDALVKAGVDAARVGSIGYGLSAPVATNDTPEGRALNRRTDILVLDTTVQSLLNVPAQPAKK